MWDIPDDIDDNGKPIPKALKPLVPKKRGRPRKEEPLVSPEVKSLKKEPPAVTPLDSGKPPRKRSAPLRREQIEDFDVPEDDELLTSGMMRGSPMGFNDDIPLDEGDKTTDTAKTIEALLGNADYRTKSELNKEEVRALSLLLEISAKFKCARLLKFSENFLALMISHQRGSRREVVQAFSGLDNFSAKREQPSLPFRIQ